jgi:catechol 2,3-dioxygenase-like lactoylglutathione lyase family enzyme
MTLQSISPAQFIVEFSVRELDVSLEFYQALGFSLQRRTARFAAVQWGEALPYLFEEPDRPAVEGPSIANVLVLVPDVEEIWRRALALGVAIERPIAVWPYGLRDFIVLDPDRFGVRFGQALPSTERPGPAAGVDG